MTMPVFVAACVGALVLWYLATRGVPHLAKAHRVVDGDSIEIMYRRGPSRIRLHGIDAPEYHTQPHGRDSRTALAAMLGSGRFLVVPNGTDRYGRVLCRIVTRRGPVSAAMAWRGHAWGETVPTKILAFYAMVAGRGLWCDRSAVHPRIWRLAGTRHPRAMRGTRR